MTDDNHAMPEGLPAQFWDEQAGAVKLPEMVKSYGELATFKAQEDERLKGLPKAEDYKMDGTLPHGFMVPHGFEPKINEKDPHIAPLREFAAKHHLSQDQVSAIIGLDLQAQVKDQLAADEALQAEMMALGANGKARIAAVERGLAAHLDETDFNAVRPFIDSAVALSAMEKILARLPEPQMRTNGTTTRERPADVFYGGKG